MSSKPRIICIVGPTASGKTALALALARMFGGEIVNADSRQVYRGMDVATAKTIAADVPHHCFDLVEPDQPFSLSDWLLAARTAIADIHRRGKLPILVGGTALYVRALTENLHMPEVAPYPALRERLEAMTVDELLRELVTRDPKTAAVIDQKNPRRLVRALEVVLLTGKSFSELATRGEPEYEALILGLMPDRDALRERVEQRVDAMIEGGLVEEARRLAERYPQAFAPRIIPSFSGIGYPEAYAYLEDGDEEAMRTALIDHTMQYARRQMTFFKKLPVTWVASAEQAQEIAQHFLAV